jgi:hypothetical protein
MSGELRYDRSEYVGEAVLWIREPVARHRSHGGNS